MKEIQKLITDIVEASGIFIEDIKMSDTGGTIKVICDTEKGISSSELVKVTRKILNDTEYDEKYALSFRLEVSSPGLDMPLTKVHHFKKNIGHDIDLEHNSEEYKVPLKGTIKDVDDDALSLIVKIKKENTTIRIPMKNVISAMVRLKW
ncbi:MAG: hypothetical protein U9O95_02015 [Candidatus Marinimicrobia bacterium]|nr:hypothetical protein [Candidatus Neomarinimicrobiota bacterium]